MFFPSHFLTQFYFSSSERGRERGQDGCIGTVSEELDSAPIRTSLSSEQRGGEFFISGYPPATRTDGEVCLTHSTCGSPLIGWWSSG